MNNATVEELLTTLIGFKTVTEDTRTNRAALEWVSEQLAPHMTVTLLENEGFTSLVATSRNTKTPILWLAAHIDVVAAPDEMFTVQRDDDRIVGRGAFDMKFAIACFIALVQEMGESVLEYDFGIMIAADEEITGPNGIQYILSQGYSGELAFLPDGGEGWSMQRSAKGVWRIRVIAQGKSAHGSRPWEGENANIKLYRFISDIYELFEDPECDGVRHDHNTLNVGVHKGGTTANVVPDRAEAHVDIRLVSGCSKEKIFDEMEAIRVRHDGIEMREMVYNSSHATDQEQSQVQAWKDVALELHGISTGSVDAHGSSDAHHFHDIGVNVLLVRPDGGAAHADDEWIGRTGLAQYYDVLREWVTRVCCVSKCEK